MLNASDFSKVKLLILRGIDFKKNVVVLRAIIT